MQRITPCLWFDDQAEAAAKFYTSIFDNSKILGIARYGEAASAAAGRPAGTAMTVEFEIEGQKFLALNGGPHFKFTEAVSFIVNCKTQREVDELWEKLSKGGQEGPCGWLKDRFGLSWQVVPTVVGEMLRDGDPRKTDHVMAAILTMKKLEIAELEEAYGR
jgi:predicted 3-demethylubiquinone-9 3-methyltransferase (glyoxalase superfamily)